MSLGHTLALTLVPGPSVGDWGTLCTGGGQKLSPWHGSWHMSKFTSTLIGLLLLCLPSPLT